MEWVKYRMKPSEKKKTWTFLWRCVSGVVVFRGIWTIKYNKVYSTKLIETSVVDNIYDFESNHLLNSNLKKNSLRPTATLSTYFWNEPCMLITKKKIINLMFYAVLKKQKHSFSLSMSCFVFVLVSPAWPGGRCPFCLHHEDHQPPHPV